MLSSHSLPDAGEAVEDEGDAGGARSLSPGRSSRASSASKAATATASAHQKTIVGVIPVTFRVASSPAAVTSSAGGPGGPRRATGQTVSRRAGGGGPLETRPRRGRPPQET